MNAQRWSVERAIRKMPSDKMFSWQKLYYDRIIRNEKELMRIREYIENNTVKWEHEKNNHYCGADNYLM